MLEGNGNAERLPTIMLVAHYDSFGLAPVSEEVNEMFLALSVLGDNGTALNKAT